MYIPKRVARNFGRALDEGDPLATGFAVNIMIVMGGLIASFPIIAAVECNEHKEGIKLINAQIVKDINEKINANIQEFSTDKIIIKDSDARFTIKVIGKVNDGKMQNNASSVQYKISAEDFETLKNSVNFDKYAVDGIMEKETGSFPGAILYNIVEVIKNSEFLSAEINNVNLIKNSEMTVEVSESEIDEKAKNVSYTLSLTKMENDNLKMAWFKISAPLSKELKENPNKIYSMNKNDVKIEKIDEFTQNGVDYVYKQKNHFMAVPKL